MNNHPPHPLVLPQASQNYPADVGQFGASDHQQLLKAAAEHVIVPCRSVVCHDPAAGYVGRTRGRETAGMKTFMAAVAVLAAIAVPAYAQLNAKRHQGDEKKTEQKQPQVDEKAYKAALERIPEPKDKYDPWAVTKPADPVKKPK
jgi:hypothetical protein